MKSLQQATSKIQCQRKSGKSKPLSAWGLECNLAFQAADKILDKQERMKFEDENKIVA